MTSFNTAERWRELHVAIQAEATDRIRRSQTLDTPANQAFFPLAVLNEHATKALIAAKEAYNRNSRVALRTALQDLGALYYGSKELGHPISEPVELPLLCQKLLELDGFKSE